MSRVTRVCIAGAVVGLLAAGGASVVAGEELRIAIGGGRVTLIADDATLGEALAAWARAGGTQFAGAEPIEAAPVSLHLVDVDEAQALRWLLRPAAGYVALSRARPDPGASLYERVEIRAASVPSRPMAARDGTAGSEPGQQRSDTEAAPGLDEAAQRERLRQLLRPPDIEEAAPAAPTSGTADLPLTTSRPGMVVETIPADTEVR